MATDSVFGRGSREGAVQARSVLDDIVREGARRLLQAALEAEVAEQLARFCNVVDTAGRQAVVRNGHLPVKQPRARDRSGKTRFTSKILPPFLRRVPSLDALIPVLYLKGISTGDFSEALASILGPDAPGLSTSNIVRLKEGWEQEYRAWNTRDLIGKRYVYIWADGLYFNVRLDRDWPFILVMMGATHDGTKELLAVWDGQRENKLSWQMVLRELKQRGLRDAPKLAIGDGALGFWAAMEEEFATTQQQRCWVHKTANILDKVPRSVQLDAKKLIHEMYMAPALKDAKCAYDAFVARYSPKYSKVVTCLTKDQDVLSTFYSFPAEHWRHLRTTNPIESTLATVRHLTRQTKGCGSRMATMAMVYKLAIEAQRHWRRLNGHVLLLKVIAGVPFVYGEIEDTAA